MKKIMILLLGLLTFSLQAAPEIAEKQAPGIQEGDELLVLDHLSEAPEVIAASPTMLESDYLLVSNPLASAAILEVGAALPFPTYAYRQSRRNIRRQSLRQRSKANKDPPIALSYI